MCGLPGYGPGDLIDMAFDGDRVTITYDAGIDRPLRLTPGRGAGPGGGAADAGPGARRSQTATRSSGPWRRSSRPPATRADGLPVRGPACPAPAASRVAELQGAVAAPARTAPDLLHGDPGRDHRAGRRPDAGPARRWLRPTSEAWCRRAEAVRRFRADRIDVVHRAGRAGRRRRPTPGCTDVSDGHLHAQPRAAAGHAADRAAGPGGSPSTTRASGWCEETPDRWLVSLRASDLAWARRLVLGPGPGRARWCATELVEAVRTEARSALAAYEVVVGADGPADR